MKYQKIHTKIPNSLKPLKKLGQNFLIENSVVEKILLAAGDISNKNIIEIGPGLGMLTNEIKKNNPLSLTLIEYDTRFAEALNKIKADNIIWTDVLEVDFKQIAKASCIILSNLPYNISVELLYKLLPDFQLFESFIFMFQAEVANRISANPNSRAYGKLSVIMQTFANIEKILDVGPECFFPIPAVESTVLKITPITDNNDINITEYNSFLSKLFENKRKKLKKKLLGVISSIDEFVTDKNDLRAENITVEEYIKLFKLSK